MRLPLAAILLLSPIISSCGGPNVEGPNDGGSGQGDGPPVFDGWAVRAGGAGQTSEMPSKLGVYPDGSSVVVGTFPVDITFGEGEPDETMLVSAGVGSLFVARYAADGTLMWARSAGGPSVEYPWDVDVVSDGSCVVSGVYHDGAVFGLGEPTETTLHTLGAFGGAFVARYAADGSLSWVASASGTSWTSATGVGTLPDGSCVVAGALGASVTFGAGEPNETTLQNTGVASLFVARYASDGTLVWARLGAASNEAGARGLDTLADGSSFVTGEFTGTLSLGPGPNRTTVEVTALGDTDAFLLRYDGDGVPQWATTAGTPMGVVVGQGATAGYDVAALLDGTAVVTGTFFGFARFGGGEPNETMLISAGGPWTDVFFARYGSSGDLLWAEGAGGPGSDYANAITAHDDGSIYVSGSFYGETTFGLGETNETVLTSAGGWDAFVARLFPDGRLRWVRQAGGPEGDASTGIGVRPDHSCVATGYFWGTVEFGSGSLESLTSLGGWDVFLARYGPNGEL
jgi:hypothetical protein